jgi:AhpD family alkylhydroperoxidase
MQSFADMTDDLREPTRDLRHLIPDTWSGVAQLHQSALADGALSARVKELMALAISVVKRCDGCIAHHAKRAARLGATPEEVAEALGVALLMDGGPATVYAPRALQAYREFAQPNPD